MGSRVSRIPKVWAGSHCCRPPPCPGSLFLLVGAQALLEEATK